MVNRQVLIGLVIPCYNEENRLDVNTYISFLKQNKNINLLFINDGSNDNTIDVIKTITSKNTNAKTINLKTNVGKGEAVRQGVLQLCKGKYSYIGYWDADLSTSLEEGFICNEFFKRFPTTPDETKYGIIESTNNSLNIFGIPLI